MKSSKSLLLSNSPLVKSSTKKDFETLFANLESMSLYHIACFRSVPFNKNGELLTPKTTLANRFRVITGLSTNTLSNRKNLR